MVYLGTQLGSRSVRVRDLTTGKAINLVTSPIGFFNPRISGDGATVAYSDGGGNLFSVPRAGGAVATLCAGCGTTMAVSADGRSEEHTSELQSLRHLVCRLLLEKKTKNTKYN